MEPEVFHLDEGHPPVPSPRPLSSPGASTPSNEEQNADIPLERRVVGLIECSDDICSVCLDEYTSQDPGAPTVCGHHFHLQCIMQWAQRSRECPLCFRTLQLEDEDMNSLLPFGEYVSPQQLAAEAATVETWELERLLIRLATASQREQRHHHRSGRHHSSSAAGAGAGAAATGSSSSSRHRRQGSRGEASAPQAIQASSGAAVASGSASVGAQWSLPGEGGTSRGSVTEAVTPPPVATGVAARAASAPGAAYPSSWPPAAGSEPPGSSSSMQDDGHMVSPRSRPGSLSLKNRLAALRLKDKFDKTTKELRSLFSPSGSSGGGTDHDRRGGSSQQR